MYTTHKHSIDANIESINKITNKKIREKLLELPCFFDALPNRQDFSMLMRILFFFGQKSENLRPLFERILHSVKQYSYAPPYRLLLLETFLDEIILLQLPIPPLSS